MEAIICHHLVLTASFSFCSLKGQFAHQSVPPSLTVSPSKRVRSRLPTACGLINGAVYWPELLDEAAAAARPASYQRRCRSCSVVPVIAASAVQPLYAPPDPSSGLQLLLTFFFSTGPPVQIV